MAAGNVSRSVVWLADLTAVDHVEQGSGDAVEVDMRGVSIRS